jgi:hypothetical protein
VTLFAPKLRRWAGFALLAVMTTTAAACDNDPTGEDDEPEIADVRVTIGNQTVTINEAGAQSGTLTVPRGQSNVTVAFLRDNGQPETLVTAAEFELRLVPRTGTTGITFTANGVTGGTINTTSAGQKSLDLQLYHREEDHTDFNRILTITSQ